MNYLLFIKLNVRNNQWANNKFNVLFNCTKNQKTNDKNNFAEQDRENIIIYAKKEKINSEFEHLLVIEMSIIFN